jgi:hypothetical protein
MMALFGKLIPIQTRSDVATATSATSATRGSDNGVKIAKVAEVAVANQNEMGEKVAEVAEVAVATPQRGEVVMAEIAVASATPGETPQQKVRRERVSKMLADSPHVNHVMLVDDSNPDPDYHIVAMAVRNAYGGATSEILIPRAKMDIWQLMEFIQQHGQSIH